MVGLIDNGIEFNLVDPLFFLDKTVKCYISV